MMWQNKLGLPGPDNAHALRFIMRPAPNGVDPALCRLPSGRWNSINDFDSVVITIDRQQDAPGQATMGWRPSAFHGGGEDHFNSLIINPNILKPDQAWLIAHELGEPSERPNTLQNNQLTPTTGHVLGYAHEQNRDDRDDWLDYKCENVQGYAEAEKKVKDAGKHTMDQVCKSAMLCFQYDFAGHLFTKNMWSRNFDTETFLHKGPYLDLKSIM